MEDGGERTLGNYKWDIDYGALIFHLKKIFKINRFVDIAVD